MDDWKKDNQWKPNQELWWPHTYFVRQTLKAKNKSKFQINSKSLTDFVANVDQITSLARSPLTEKPQRGKKLPVMFNWSLKSCLEPIWQNPKRERTKEIPDEKNFCDFGKIRHDKFENVCFCCDTDLNGVLVTFYRELNWSFFGN